MKNSKTIIISKFINKDALKLGMTTFLYKILQFKILLLIIFHYICLIIALMNNKKLLILDLKIIYKKIKHTIK